MPPKKKPKRAKSGMKQKQRQTQIVTVNVGVRRRRRVKKSGSGTASGAPPPPPPSRQQFVQTIYPTTNPFQQDMHFNLASISAQLKNLQNVGGVPLGSVLTQQQIQLGAAPQDPSLDTTPVVRVASPELPREAPLVIDVDNDPMSDKDVSTQFKPISVPAEDTPFKPIYVPLSDPAPVSRRADGEPEDTPYDSLTFTLTPTKQRGAPKLTDIEKQERAEKREEIRIKNLSTPVVGEPIYDPVAKIKSNPLGSVGGGEAYATLVGATESFFTQTIAQPSETEPLTPESNQPTIDQFFARQGKTY